MEIRETVGLLIGAAVGLGVGFLVPRVLRHKPLLQTMLAMVLAWLLASVAAAGVYFVHPLDDIDVLAVTFGLPQAIVTTAVVALLALVLHVVSEWTTGALHSAVASRRVVVVGILGGLGGARAFAEGFGVLRPWLP